ncbi:MAG: COP23 domain-containing protein [Leptolyngbyaceae cyanobacterium MO_188.B28]|nr:COP23 domain-containing protein [Leptolyngbyaceae cyanobacterium MO_188.B28]
MKPLGKVRWAFIRRTGSLVLLSGALAAVTGMIPLAGKAQTGEAQSPDAGTSQSDEPSALEDAAPRFACQVENGQYTVMYSPESQPDQSYAWATPTELGGGWTEERRCNAISSRLETYRPEGLLELRTGTENGYNIVCATTERDPNECSIVFTVPPGQDPVVTRDRVFENLILADRGDATQSVTTFTGNGGVDVLGQIGQVLGTDLSTLTQGSRSRSSSINLKPYLDPADGGTGAYLQGGSAQPGRALDPDNFR